MNGIGSGVGAVTIYGTDDQRTAIVFMVWHRPGYTTYAGCYIDDYTTIKGMYDADLKDNNDVYLTDLLNKVYNADNTADNAKITYGNSVVAKKNGIQCTVTAGLVSSFFVENTVTSFERPELTGPDSRRLVLTRKAAAY